MTTPQELDHIITEAQEGKPTTPQSPEEVLSVKLVAFAQSFELKSELDSELQSTLQKISDASRKAKKARTQPYGAVMRAGIAAAIAILLSTLLIISVPPLRAFAQEILDEIGSIVFTDTPTVPELQRDGLHTPSPLPTDYVDRGETLRILTYAELDELLDFPIYTANYIPAGYQHYGYMGNFFGQEPLIARATYGTQGSYPDTLYISQTPVSAAEPYEFAIGDAGIREIEVNGSRAIFVDGALVGTRYSIEGERSFEGWNFLYWEQDGFQFSLQSRGLTETDLVQIAESLAP